MNKLKFSLIVTFILIIISSSAFSEPKQNAEAVLLDDNIQIHTYTQPNFAKAELCSVNHTGLMYWLIDFWLTGDEQYLVYQDPEMTCMAPYPFTVKEVLMILYFEKEAIINVSANINVADFSDSSCPVPGDVISVSSDYTFQLKPAGLWRISVPLDEPIVAMEPYFASFNILTQFVNPNLGSQDSVRLVTDSIPGVCQNYNLWDPNIGYVDLGDNEIYNFPGKLTLFSAGDPGGYPSYVCGDANNDELTNNLDVAFLIEYYFHSGPEPLNFVAGDLNCDGTIGLIDLVLLNNNLFHGGEANCCF